MGLGNKKKTELKYHIDVEEFIPYAAHFDEETLITKNGELLQIIKLTGFAFETIKEEKEGLGSLRSLIRNALKNNIKSDKFALWIHTIRKEKDISTGGFYQNSFAHELNERWIEKNKWRTQFVNELYITVVSEGDVFPMRNPKNIINNLFVRTHIEERKLALLQSSKKLSEVTAGIIRDLGQFGARKLTLFKKDGFYRSELISLASKLMNLRQEEIPIQIADLSTVLPTHKVSFQYNTVLVEGETGKHFGAVFSIKDYREITDEELDKMIQLPVNFIISQSFNFVGKEEAQDSFEDQKKIYELSGAKRMMEISGIKEIFEVDDDINNFGESQIIVTVLEGSVKALQKASSDVVDVLREMGLTFVREDLFMETCYWSMMPANFDFIKRKSYLPANKVGGFAALHSFTTGKLDNNLWGYAVTTFPTRNNLPYFFNFHTGNNGHTIIVGSGEQRKTLTNFLVSQSQKFNPRTFIIESDGASESFIKALGGSYTNDTENFVQGVSKQDKNIFACNIAAEKERLMELLGKIENNMSKETPSIIIISDQFNKINDPELSNKLVEFGTRVIEKNALIIFLSDGSEKLEAPGVFGEKLLELVQTKIFLPAPASGFDLKEAFHLKEKELREIKKLSVEEGEFILKKNNIPVILRLVLPSGNRQSEILLSSQTKND